MFGGNKPKVTKREFDESVQSMYSRGLHHDKIQKVKDVLHGSLSESGVENGIDAKEIDSAVEYMEKNKGHLSLTDKDIGIVSESLKKRL
ncbi:MAG: hypothetical protein KAR00_01950 [Candidatus Pacebacteria bacterium]|nr:hypothetical protein [Candidatus Paceibacterota bacterium]